MKRCLTSYASLLPPAACSGRAGCSGFAALGGAANGLAAWQQIPRTDAACSVNLAFAFSACGASSDDAAASTSGRSATQGATHAVASSWRPGGIGGRTYSLSSHLGYAGRSSAAAEGRGRAQWRPVMLHTSASASSLGRAGAALRGALSPLLAAHRCIASQAVVAAPQASQQASTAPPTSTGGERAAAAGQPPAAGGASTVPVAGVGGGGDDASTAPAAAMQAPGAAAAATVPQAPAPPGAAAAAAVAAAAAMPAPSDDLPDVLAGLAPDDQPLEVELNMQSEALRSDPDFMPVWSEVEVS